MRREGSKACFTTLLQVGDVIFFPWRIYQYVPIEKSVCGVYRNLLAGFRRMRERSTSGGISCVGDRLCRGFARLRVNSLNHGVCNWPHFGMPFESRGVGGVGGGEAIPGVGIAGVCSGAGAGRDRWIGGVVRDRERERGV